MTTLPKLPDGRIAWTRLLAKAKPGDVLVLPRALRHQAMTHVSRHTGLRCRSQGDGDTCRIKILARPAAQSEPTRPVPRIVQLARLRNRIQNTADQVAKWKVEANERSTHAGRTEAGALVLLYQSQLRVLRAEFAALSAPPAILPC